MVYYVVQFLAPLTGSWTTLKDFDESEGIVVPVFDSAEQLGWDEAHTRLALLSEKYPHLAFRIEKQIH